MDQAISATDAAVADLRADNNLTGSLSDSAKAQFQRALDALNGLSALRNTATTTDYPGGALLRSYENINTALLNTATLATQVTGSTTVAQEVSALNAVSQAKDQAALQDAFMYSSVLAGGFVDFDLQSFRDAQGAFNAAVTQFNTAASPALQSAFIDTVTGPQVDDRELLQQIAVSNANIGQPLSVSPDQLAGDDATTEKLLAQVENSATQETATTASELAATARSSAIRDGLLILIILLVALAIMLVVTRALLVSLRQLRLGALEVARDRLPATITRILAAENPIEASRQAVDPVPPFSFDEVGEVARSFDVVHGQAVRLAAEQAVLRDNVNAIFVNLSRRSQALVERQLGLIDRLERDEQDPDNLANLFELDHLATRMRRNSESLLVLSGSGLAKRMSRPVPIGELVGAAVSEVEQYARIEVGSPPDASVLGRVVNDLIHLIAELLDNATSYSEPNTKVSVRIARTKSRELAIQITDRGVGMSEDDVRGANESLANPPDIDVGVTRRMGLYVVARLAKRHGIRVKLRTNEDIDGGTVALVVIPESLVYRPGDDVTPSPSVDTALPARRGTEPGASNLDKAASAAAGIAGAFGMARTGEDSSANVRPVSPPAPEPGYGRGEDYSGPIGEPLTLDGSGPLPAITNYWSPELTSAGDTGSTPAGDQWQPEASSSAVLWEPHTSVESGWDAEPESTTFNGTMSLDEYTSGPLGGPSHIEVDAPTERLPIYEAVLSQWFRADRPAADAAGAVEEPEPAEAAASVPEPPMAASAEAEESVPGGLPTRVPGKAGATLGFGQSRSSEEPANGHEPGGQSDAWHSAADEGWQAAEALLTRSVSETTSAGLPKRTPKAQLVPGSAAPRGGPESSHGSDSTLVTAGVGGSTGSRGTSRPMLPPRSADAVRGRMSSFQQGLRRGRHALIEGYSDEASVSSEHQSVEEQE
jgi:signal transduction histidine kinase